MKEFYGAVSLTARLSFCVEAVDKDEAENIVFEDIEGLEIILKNGTKLSISEVNWDLIRNASRGNVQESNVSDFDIEEES